VYLRHLTQHAAVPLLKLLRSAIASAKHSFNLDSGNLYISEIRVDGGPVLKRFRPRAFGRAASIKKRTSHVVFILDEHKTPVTKKRRFAVRQERKPGALPTLEELEKPQGETFGDKERKARPLSPANEKSRVQKRITEFGKRFFRRKSV